MLYARRFWSLLLLLPLLLAACSSPQRSPESAYIVNAQGATSPTARSALAGSTAPGKQEIIGIYIPFLGTGLALKGGLEYDGTPTVIEIPIGQAAPADPQYVEEQETYYVPETRMIPKTRAVRKAVIPVPRAAPYCAPPAPAPQKAPGCEPPPGPVACSGEACGLQR